jgi:hypothetical protein
VDPSVPADAAAIPAPVVMSTVVTHDYLMECVLCGKGADEQVHHSNDRPAESAASSSSSGVGSSSTAPAPVASISLGAIQLPNVPAAAQPKMDAKEEEEWA